MFGSACYERRACHYKLVFAAETPAYACHVYRAVLCGEYVYVAVADVHALVGRDVELCEHCLQALAVGLTLVLGLLSPCRREGVVGI